MERTISRSLVSEAGDGDVDVGFGGWIAVAVKMLGVTSGAAI